MLPLLFSVIFSETVVIVLLLFKSPLRRLLIMILDKMKQGKGPIIMKTVSGTIFTLFVTTVHTVFTTGRDSDPGKLNPTDQILLVRHLLDSSLMGFILFLGLMIDRLHHYVRELGLVRKTMEANKKQQPRSFQNGEKNNNGGNIDEASSMADQIAALKTQVEKLESLCASKSDEAKSADAKAEALKKQCDGLLGEYDHLLEDNQSLRTQLREIDDGNVSQSHHN